MFGPVDGSSERGGVGVGVGVCAVHSDLVDVEAGLARHCDTRLLQTGGIGCERWQPSTRVECAMRECTWGCHA